jgi:hypothetical protein
VTYEALLDVIFEGLVGHVLKKGDMWPNKANVSCASEIVWTSDDIMNT